MKVAFLGAHGVGKTTLCFDLASRLKRLDMAVDIVKEVARLCPLPINRETTVEAQAWILHTQIAHELAASTQYQAVICDRSVLDNYAYLVHAAGRRPEYDALVSMWLQSYDALFKVPVLDHPSFDGTRDTGLEWQRDIDQVIDRLLAEFQVSCQRLDGDRDAWMDKVLTTLRLPLRPPQIDIFSAT